MTQAETSASDTRVIFELSPEDSETVLRQIKSGAWNFGYSHLSIQLDNVTDGRLKLWTGATGRLRIIQENK